ncbi:hypothetical protein DFH09DRAFT_1087919 [Mycena vulgaris]|nr:hypothetical protein DFH09DRAFT_1087919 [Mycena vulgaris]
MALAYRLKGRKHRATPRGAQTETGIPGGRGGGGGVPHLRRRPRNGHRSAESKQNKGGETERGGAHTILTAPQHCAYIAASVPRSIHSLRSEICHTAAAQRRGAAGRSRRRLWASAPQPRAHPCGEAQDMNAHPRTSGVKAGTCAVADAQEHASASAIDADARPERLAVEFLGNEETGGPVNWEGIRRERMAVAKMKSRESQRTSAEAAESDGRRKEGRPAASARGVTSMMQNGVREVVAPGAPEIVFPGLQGGGFKNGRRLGLSSLRRIGGLVIVPWKRMDGRWMDDGGGEDEQEVTSSIDDIGRAPIIKFRCRGAAGPTGKAEPEHFLSCNRSLRHQHGR